MPTQAPIRSLDLLPSLLIGLALLTPLSANVSFAQDAPRATAAARALFDEGLACADRADWACAVDRFGRAHALRSSPVILSNYAIALGHAGRLVEASESYRALSRDAAAPPELREAAQRAISELALRIGRITIVAEGPIEGVAITMDGTILAMSLLGVPIPSDPGEHVVDARRAGALVASAHVHLAPAASTSVALTIAADPADALMVEVPRPSLAATDPESPRLLAGAPLDGPRPEAAVHHEIYEEWWLWTIVGVAVVGIGVGVTVGVIESQGTTLPSGSLGTIDGRL